MQVCFGYRRLGVFQGGMIPAQIAFSVGWPRLEGMIATPPLPPWSRLNSWRFWRWRFGNWRFGAGDLATGGLAAGDLTC